MQEAFVFPGQCGALGGNWKVLLGHKAGQTVINESKEVLGYCIYDRSPEELATTRYGQLSILIYSLACDAVLKDFGFKPDIVAGHSLGIFSGLCSAGVIARPAAILLVQERGEIMHESPPGKMAAIIGLELKLLTRICDQVSKPGNLVVVANENGRGQTVISGYQGAVARIAAAAKERGARKVVFLGSEHAFHSPLMFQSSYRFLRPLIRTKFRNPQKGVAVIFDGERLTSGEAIQERLLYHMDRPVKFTDTVEKMLKLGARRFFEVGPGTTLTGIIRQQASNRKDGLVFLPFDDRHARSSLGVRSCE